VLSGLWIWCWVRCWSVADGWCFYLSYFVSGVVVLVGGG